MILKIMDNAECGLDDMVLTPANFADLAYHPYIATQEFEKVVIQLSPVIPNGYIAQVAGRHKVIPKFDEITDKVIMQLAEIYPDHASELRVYSRRDKAKLEELISQLREQYNWDVELNC